jgi:hypothetical protein
MAMVEPSGAERRSHPRMPAARKIYIVDDPRSWKCSLLDVAEKGARLSTAGIKSSRRTSSSSSTLAAAACTQALRRLALWDRGRRAVPEVTQRIGPRAGGAAGALEIARKFAATLPVEPSSKRLLLLLLLLMEVRPQAPRRDDGGRPRSWGGPCAGTPARPWRRGRDGR